MPLDILDELTTEKREAIERMREITDQDTVTPEQDKEWDKLNSRVDEIDEDIQQARRDLERATRMDELNEKVDRQEHRKKTEVGEARQRRAVVAGQETPDESQRSFAFQAFLLRANGLGDRLTDQNLSAEHIIGRDGASLMDGYGDYFHQPYSYRNGVGIWDSGANGRCSPHDALKMDLRAGLNVGTATEGPELIPEGFVNQLEHTLLAFGGLRRICRIISTASGNDLPWPTMDDTGNTGALLAEATDMGASVDPATAAVTFKAYKYSSKPILVSAELLMDSAFNLAMELGAALGERIGRITATHYATGDNSAKPQGITVGASTGITTASNSAITADELINLQDSVDPAYAGLPSIGWAFRKATITTLRKLKDTTNQYLWQPGLQAGEPNTLLGDPVATIQEIPAIATTAVAGIYGAFEKYVIRDAGPARSFRLDELYRASDQTGFVQFARHDGRVLQAGALKKLTMAV